MESWVFLTFVAQPRVGGITLAEGLMCAAGGGGGGWAGVGVGWGGGAGPGGERGRQGK